MPFKIKMFPTIEVSGNILSFHSATSGSAIPAKAFISFCPLHSEWEKLLFRYKKFPDNAQ